jgi:adenine-specific DNA-methyltransferase
VNVLEQVDRRRQEVTRRLDPSRRAELGQFLTPAPLASFMAGFFERIEGDVRLLEAGAGVGTLLAAAVVEAQRRRVRPRRIDAVAFEIDPFVARDLSRTVLDLEASSPVPFTGSVVRDDFVAAGLARMSGKFTHAILNPPYKKLGASADARVRLRRAGIEVSNLYAAFVALAVRLLEPGGELVAITPRSFTNGPYFRAFRELLLAETALVRLHLFDSRKAAFSDDDVLQENVVLHAVKGRSQGSVVMSSSPSPGRGGVTRTIPFSRLVRPGDPERFIHFSVDARSHAIADAFAGLPSTLADLGLSVSTGKVVDFRAKAFLRAEPTRRSHPLVYPAHLVDGIVSWPRRGKKPNALVDEARTRELWMPRGTYVLVKRFSSKEEARRVVAGVFDPELVPADKIAFENHLNVFHAGGQGLGRHLARGLAAFLNSSIVDAYVRQWSGHTQINATDLRSLRYPARGALEALGRADRANVDALVRALLTRSGRSASPG